MTVGGIPAVQIDVVLAPGASSCSGTEGRGYLIWLAVSGDDPQVGRVFNRAWFDVVLATVELNPQDAVASRQCLTSIRIEP